MKETNLLRGLIREMCKKPTLEAWFAGDSSIRKQKILGITEEAELVE